ncbi:MAG TPA: selenocysteine-specific translation elongation factor, partial [Pseudomonadota bacterium]|nr:selenocysteine-specific translation elongation factor [Pseudomonadota bacterium]
MSLHRVLGTAGHIDHGKTSLVKALTGIDTDRLKEEQERGITIELGFAHLRLPSGDVVGVVDVPGHERFIRTMVAGAVGIDAVVLVVAADEGVMPQTREHLDICELLGVRTGVVALSKSDLCEPELRELATLELRETLRGTFLAQAPIVPCSARTGEGLPELVAAIAKVLATAPGRDERGILRLPVDRVFSLHGFGTVATGTLWSGRLQVGDELVPLPGPRSEKLPPAKVRGLHVHGVAVSEAAAGQRTAVNLTLPLAALSRGETLVRPGTLQAGVLLDVRLQLLGVARAPLGRRSRLLLHAGTTQRLAQVTLLDRGELQPGGWARAQLQVDAPLGAQPGDRFVLRGFAPQKNHGT